MKKYFLFLFLVVMIHGFIIAGDPDCIHDKFKDMSEIQANAIITTSHGTLSKSDKDSIDSPDFQKRCSLFGKTEPLYKCVLIEGSSVTLDPEPMIDAVESQSDYGACYIGAALANLNYNVDPNKKFSFSDAMCVGNKNRYKDGGSGISSLIKIAKKGELVECDFQKRQHNYAVFEINDAKSSLGAPSSKEVAEIEKKEFSEVKKVNKKCERSKIPPFSINEIIFNNENDVLDKILSVLRDKKMVFVGVPEHEFNIYGINLYECKNEKRSIKVQTVKILDPNARKMEVVANDIVKGISEKHELFFLKKENKNINIKDVYPGLRGLIYVAKTGDTELLLTYLDKLHSNINTQLDDGTTALYYAASEGHKDVVNILLRKGSDPNIVRKNDNTTPLFLAAQNGNEGIVKALLDKGADPNIAMKNDNVTPLFMAVQKENKDIIKLLLKSKTIRIEVDAPGLNKQTPLFMAVRKRRKDLVILLLQKNANINAETSNGTTPLTLAIQMGDKEITQLLKAKNNLK